MRTAIHDAAADNVLKFAVMASAVRPVDPMDKAVHALASGVLDQMGLDADSGPDAPGHCARSFWR